MNGKIIQSELINRKNDKETNQPISFEYDLLVENETGNKTELPFRFNRLGDKTWLVEMVFGIQVYKVMFDVPKVNMDLVMVAAFGLRNIQYELQKEIQQKSIIDFTIGDETKDM